MQMTAPAREYLESEMSKMNNVELSRFGEMLHGVNVLRMRYKDMAPFVETVKYAYNRVQSGVDIETVKEIDKRVADMPEETREKGDELLKFVASRGIEPNEFIRYGTILVNIANIEMSVAGKHFE